jgi:hypothetical protein
MLNWLFRAEPISNVSQEDKAYPSVGLLKIQVLGVRIMLITEELGARIVVPRVTCLDFHYQP